MNCGIVTLYDSLNFGAFLQAFAVKTTIEEEFSRKAILVNLEKNRFLERLFLIKCNPILRLKAYHHWASFPPWRCFIPVSVALLRLPSFRFARTKNPSQIC